MKNSNRHHLNLARDIAKLWYDSLKPETFPEFKEVYKKYKGDEQLEQYLNELHSYEKDNEENRQD